MKKLLIFGFGLLISFAAKAQTIPSEETDTTKRVLVDFADVFEYIVEDGQTIQKLIGEVELRQDSIYMYCDSAFIKGENKVDAMGNVLIQQGDTLNVFSDSAHFDGTANFAQLIGNVILLNKNQKLFTDSLYYDLEDKVAIYETGAVLTNDTSQLRSKIGYYYVDEDVIYFKDEVVIVNPEFSLKADTLKFNTKTRIATFLGPTLISTKSNGKIYCEDGFYDIRNKRAEFRQNAQYVREDREASADVIQYYGEEGIYVLAGNAVFEDSTRSAKADTIQYFEADDLTYLTGNARYKENEQDVQADEIFYDKKNKAYKTSGRSFISDPPQIIEADEFDFDDERGIGIATGNVILQDTVQKFILYADAADYDKERDFMKTRGGRPMMVTIVEGDSLFMKADTLIAKRQFRDTAFVKMDSVIYKIDTTLVEIKPDSISADSLETIALDSSQLQMKFDTISTDTIRWEEMQITGDTGRIVLGYNRVRIYKSDLQAVADSLVYNLTDSLFHFYKNPVVWSDTSQFVADSIDMSMKGGQLDRIFLNRKAFIINSPDEVFFNQIKGKHITAFFKEKELRRMHVVGNAESVYYALDDQRSYIGVNKTVCSEMLLYFGNNEIERIKFISQPTAKLTPIQQAVDSEFRLEDFDWKTKSRPKGKDDLDRFE